MRSERDMEAVRWMEGGNLQLRLPGQPSRLRVRDTWDESCREVEVGPRVLRRAARQAQGWQGQGRQEGCEVATLNVCPWSEASTSRCAPHACRAGARLKLRAVIEFAELCQCRTTSITLAPPALCPPKQVEAAPTPELPQAPQPQPEPPAPEPERPAPQPEPPAPRPVKAAQAEVKAAQAEGGSTPRRRRSKKVDEDAELQASISRAADKAMHQLDAAVSRSLDLLGATADPAAPELLAADRLVAAAAKRATTMNRALDAAREVKLLPGSNGRSGGGSRSGSGTRRRRAAVAKSDSSSGSAQGGQ